MEKHTHGTGHKVGELQMFLFECGSKLRLTLDVDGDRGLLAVWSCFVGRSAGDALAALDVGGRDVQRADGALSVAVAQQRLQTNTSNSKGSKETGDVMENVTFTSCFASNLFNCLSAKQKRKELRTYTHY